MYRCIALFATLAIASTSTGWAQDLPGRQFPQNALRGEVAFGVPPEVTLNGAPSRLSPGARLRAQNNMMVLSGTLTGTKHTVHYTLENSGLIKDLWILRDEEKARKPWPTKPEHTATWSFNPGTQTWTKP
jgi:hypothetical protein